MDNMLIYIIKVNLSIILFYLCYKLFFQRDTFWMIRRIYLLASVLFSFLYPFMSMGNWLKKQEPIMTAIASIQLDEFIITPDGVGKESIFTLENMLWGIFGLIALLIFFRICIQLFSIIKRRLKGSKEELQGVDIIRMEEKITPFSFFKWIFINPSLHSYSDIAEILVHEQTHVRQWHSIDVIIGQIQTILCWFNPGAWLLEREIRYNLEFLADNHVLKSGFEPKKYQYHLLQLTYEPADNKLANQFNVLPIKKRIKMMNTKKTNKAGLMKYVLIFPIALTMLFVSNLQDMIAATKMYMENVKFNDVGSSFTTGSNVLNSSEFQTTAKQKVKFSEPVIIKDKDQKQQNEYKIKEVTVIGYGMKENEEEPLAEEKLKVFEIVETPPSFPGGQLELYNYLSKNIVYPIGASTKGIQGRVIVQFIVSETGKVIYPKIIRGVDSLLDVEAIRVVSAMPEWTPGKQAGQAVNVRYTLPIEFKLSENTKKSDLIQLSAKGTNGKKMSADKTDVYTIVDTPPTFLGGEEEMYKFLSETIKYPVEAQKRKIQGQVIAQFVIGKNGEISDVKVIRGIHPILDNEAVRVIRAMPDWNPGQQKGEKVKVIYTLPIQFKLK